MKREIIKTADGSSTIHLPDWDEHYHSKHGAIQEAKHVFIKMGLHKVLEKSPATVSILEIGFGTGLNAMVTWQEMKDRKIPVHYTAVEAYPVLEEEASQLNFATELKEQDAVEVFQKLHSSSWEMPVEISKDITLHKQKKFFSEINDRALYDLIYFDAFGARVQPELWTEEIFEKMFRALKSGGILVTYAAKGSVRRAMLQVGFQVEKLPGPPGKREMLRAYKQ